MSEIQDLIAAAKTALLQTTITGKQYDQRGQPPTGKWGEAFADLAKASDLAADPEPVPDPTPPPPTPAPAVLHGIAVGSPSFIATYHAGDFRGYMQRAADAGAQLVRMDYQAGTATMFEKAHAAAVLAGLQVVPILMIRANSSVDTGKVWAQDLIDRYGDKRIELGNEMNGAGQYAGTPNIADYLAKARAAITVLRTKPGLTLCAGGLAQYGANDSTHITAVDYMKGIAGLEVDAFAFHCYGDWAWNSLLPQLLALLPQTCSAWITEWGAATNAGPFAGGVTEQAQADEIAKRIAYMKTNPRITLDCFYSAQDHNTLLGTSKEDHFGLYRTDGSAKPGAAVFKAAVG